jgi:hypothetical protein
MAIFPRAVRMGGSGGIDVGRDRPERINTGVDTN